MLFPCSSVDPVAIAFDFWPRLNAILFRTGFEHRRQIDTVQVTNVALAPAVFVMQLFMSFLR